MKRLLVILIFFISLGTFAHPVIYKGGWVYQSSFMPEMNQTRLGYSASSRYSYVVNSNHFNNAQGYRDYTVGVNVLLKRWLNQDSQGNLYAGIHGGYYSDDKNDGAVGHGLVMADWESRRHYVVFKSELYHYENESRQSYMGRYGIAPYLAGMDELQTWLIVQAFYYKEQSKTAIITPMLRFFYRNVLWEIGHSFTGQSYLTLMVHY